MNHIGDVVSYAPPDRFITLPGLYQYSSQPEIMYTSWGNVYVHILPYILLEFIIPYLVVLDYLIIATGTVYFPLVLL